MASNAGPIQELSQTEDIVEMADIKFKIDGKILFASKPTLCINSPVFKAMFTKDFVEKDAEEIELPGKDYNSMLQFLEVIHACDIPKADNVFAIIPICHEYQCTRILKQCDKAICSVETFFDTNEDVIQTLSLASEYKLEATKCKCYQSLRHVTLSKLKYCKARTCLSDESYRELLETSIQAKEEELYAISEIFTGQSCFDWNHSRNGTETIQSARWWTGNVCVDCQKSLYKRVKTIYETFGKLQNNELQPIWK